MYSDSKVAATRAKVRAACSREEAIALRAAPRSRGQAPFAIWREHEARRSRARSVARSLCLEWTKKCEGRSRLRPARTLIAKPSDSAITASTRSVAMPLRWKVSDSNAAADAFGQAPRSRSRRRPCGCRIL